MKSAMIFGCGYAGEGTYSKIKDLYEMVAWVDNNSSLWGNKKYGIPIISPDEMLEHLNHDRDVDLFVAVVESKDIISQLHSRGVEDFYLWKEGFFFYNEKKGFLVNASFHKSFTVKDCSVLFVMNAIAGGIREYRLATVLKKYGYNVYLAYFTPEQLMSEEGFTDVYEEFFPIMSLEDLLELVNKNDFEFVHSSSEPEWLTAFLLNTNKCVIHECHDLSSANVNMSQDRLAMEYLSNIGAKGIFYPTEALRTEAMKKFNISKNKTFVVENLISERLTPEEYLPKLSEIDGKLHAVYEGSMTSSDELDKRFFEKIWIKLAKAGIVIHFYTNHKQQYCKYLDDLHSNIHYEGNISSKKLATEMTKYDVGLLIFNVNQRNKRYLESASPNKMYEYLNAGVPIATYGVDLYRSFVIENNVGREISFEDDLLKQFNDISKIHIDDNFLRENRLTIESHKEEIMSFINQVRGV